MRFSALFALAFIAGCNQSPEDPPKPVTEEIGSDQSKLTFIDPARVPELRVMAKEACLCTRSKGFAQKDACWSNFWAISNRYHSLSAASACGAGSSAFVEFSRGTGGESSKEPNFGQFDSTMMVTTDWGYGACSAEEVPAKKREYEQESSMKGC